MYGPIKDLMVANSGSSGGGAAQLSFGQKLLAGSISGGVGAYLTNPFELVSGKSCHSGGEGVPWHAGVKTNPGCCQEA
jgi:hypothetical protein